jgi:hypothetical protein
MQDKVDVSELPIITYSSIHLTILLEPQLKNIWLLIQKLKNTSGMHWDNVHGANIEGDEAEKVWNNYISQKVNFRYCLIHV